MGLLDQLAGAMGGGQGGQGGQGGMGELLGRLAGVQGNLHDPSSHESQGLQQMMRNMNPGDLTAVLSQATRGVPQQEYHDHITPGVGGTNPLGSLGSGGMATLASALMRHLGGGGAGGGGGGLGGLAGMIPGLSTQDPQRMNDHDVAALARYTQANHPDAFASAAAEAGRQDPGILQQLLGNAALRSAAMSLASKYLGGRPS